MTDPVELTLLNLDTTSKQELITPRGQYGDDYLLFSMDIYLGNKISVEKRVVTSFVSLFGELGGLYEFMATGIVYLISRYRSSSFTMAQVQTLFRWPAHDRSVARIIPVGVGERPPLQDLTRRKKVFGRILMSLA